MQKAGNGTRSLNMDIELPDGIEMLYGDRLLADVEEAARLPRRDCFASLKRYLGRPAGKLMLLNGLRRCFSEGIARSRHSAQARLRSCRRTLL